jgi:hypothetical protein
MTAPDETANQLSLGVVYHDEHLIELRCRVAFNGWVAIARAYTTQGELRQFAASTKQFGETLKGPAELDAGDDNGGGLVALRFYVINRAGHIRCHVRLALGHVPTDHRPEEVWQCAIELPTEAGLVLNFGNQLKNVAKTLSGTAELATVVR